MADWLNSVPSAWLARGVDAAEAGLLPDFALRAAIRRLCRMRLESEREIGRTSFAFAEQMATAAVATATGATNAEPAGGAATPTARPRTPQIRTAA